MIFFFTGGACGRHLKLFQKQYSIPKHIFSLSNSRAPALQHLSRMHSSDFVCLAAIYTVHVLPVCKTEPSSPCITAASPLFQKRDRYIHALSLLRSSPPLYICIVGGMHAWIQSVARTLSLCLPPVNIISKRRERRQHTVLVTQLNAKRASGQARFISHLYCGEKRSISARFSSTNFTILATTIVRFRFFAPWVFYRARDCRSLDARVSGDRRATKKKWHRRRFVEMRQLALPRPIGGSGGQKELEIVLGRALRFALPL